MKIKEKPSPNGKEKMTSLRNAVSRLDIEDPHFAHRLRYQLKSFNRSLIHELNQLIEKKLK